MSCEKLGCIGSLNIGKVPHCGYVELPFTATQNGVHYLNYDHNGYEVNVPMNGSYGNVFTLDLSKLPESRQICFKIMQPDGSFYSVNITAGNISPCDLTENDEECYWRFFIETRPSIVNRDTVKVNADCFGLLEEADLPITEIDLIDFANNNLL